MTDVEVKEFVARRDRKLFELREALSGFLACEDVKHAREAFEQWVRVVKLEDVE